MNDPKVEILKSEITNRIVNEFNLQIDEVLSMCESEIEKLMLLHLYRYFQIFRDKRDGYNLFNKFDNIGFKVTYNFSEGISLDSKSSSPVLDLLVFREFEVRPQYPITIDGTEFRLDIYNS